MSDANIKQLIERLRQRSNPNHALTINPAAMCYTKASDCYAAADMLEQYLATKQEYSDFRQLVSDVVEQADLLDLHGTEGAYKKLHRFIIPAPKPDPLVEVIEKCAGRTYPTTEDAAKEFRAALDARGLEIKEKGQ
jgi:DNA-nicking Smr family endonuclease